MVGAPLSSTPGPASSCQPHAPLPALCPGFRLWAHNRGPGYQPQASAKVTLPAPPPAVAPNLPPLLLSVPPASRSPAPAPAWGEEGVQSKTCRDHCSMGSHQWRREQLRSGGRLSLPANFYRGGKGDRQNGRDSQKAQQKIKLRWPNSHSPPNFNPPDPTALPDLGIQPRRLDSQSSCSHQPDPHHSQLCALINPDLQPGD